MKLYQITIDNDQEYEDNQWQTKLIVCNSMEEAEIRAKSWLLEEYNKDGLFVAEEVSEVDGFKVSVTR